MNIAPIQKAGLLHADVLDAKIAEALKSLSVKDAAAVVSAETGQPRRKVYARAVELAALARLSEDPVDLG